MNVLKIVLFTILLCPSVIATHEIIHNALALAKNLPATNAENLEEGVELRKKIFEQVMLCQYENALAIILLGLEQYPANFTLQKNLAGLLGDTAEVSNTYEKSLTEEMLMASKNLFAKLMSEVNDQPKIIGYNFKNEYYYRFGMHQQQYENGMQMTDEYWGTAEWISPNTLAPAGYSGYYCQGVGAAQYAKQLLIHGNREHAFIEAQKALIAWAQYFSYRNSYYNAYVHYGLALGILGYKKEMMRALQHGAELINKDLNYVEFQNVITFIDGLA